MNCEWILDNGKCCGLPATYEIIFSYETDDIQENDLTTKKRCDIHKKHQERVLKSLDIPFTVINLKI